MAVAYGSAGTYLTYGSHANTTLAAPASIADGNMLLAFVAIGAGTVSTITPPAGWANITGSPAFLDDSVGTQTRFYVFWKIAASESGSYVFTHTTSNSCGIIIRYTGVDTSTPFSPTPTVNTGSSTTATATGFITTVANTFIVFTEQDWGVNAVDTVVPAGSTPTFTERADDIIVYVADGTLATAGATGSISHTCNNTGSNPWAAYLIGLNPAGAGGTTTLTAAGGSYTVTGATAGDKYVMPLKAAGE